MPIQDIPLTLVDVGALGGVQEKWRHLTNMLFVGFEPDSRGLESSFKRDDKQQIWNVGLAGSDGTRTFYLTQEPCNSSLLKPNLDVIRSLAWRENDFSITKQVEVPCRTLDHVIREGNISPDMIKLDTQGSECEILQGATTCLQNVLAVEVEVEFMPLYEKQKLFADVDIFMRSQGFILMDLGNQLYVKGRHSENIGLRKGYLVSADALYFKAPEYILRLAETASDKKLMSLLPIADVYGYLNFAYDVMNALKSKNPERYKKLDDPLGEIHKRIPTTKIFTISERKYFWFKNFFERRAKQKNATWNYGLGNPKE